MTADPLGQVGRQASGGLDHQVRAIMRRVGRRVHVQPDSAGPGEFPDEPRLVELAQFVLQFHHGRRRRRAEGEHADPPLAPASHAGQQIGRPVTVGDPIDPAEQLAVMGQGPVRPGWRVLGLQPAVPMVNADVSLRLVPAGQHLHDLAGRHRLDPPQRLGQLLRQPGPPGHVLADLHEPVDFPARPQQRHRRDAQHDHRRVGSVGQDLLDGLEIGRVVPFALEAEVADGSPVQVGGHLRGAQAAHRSAVAGQDDVGFVVPADLRFVELLDAHARRACSPQGGQGGDQPHSHHSSRDHPLAEGQGHGSVACRPVGVAHRSPHQNWK